MLVECLMENRDFHKQPIAKIICPNFSGILARERLFELIHLEQGRLVKWIQGPPGSGKTTLVADYLKTNQGRHIWYQIDETDSDLSSFYYYLGLAAEKTSAQATKRLPLFTPEHRFSLPVFTRKYFQQFYTLFSPPFALVFDNYHIQPIESDLHDIMRMGIEEAPPGVTIIFISRMPLPQAFRRLQANNFIDLIGWDDLRLTETEFREIAFLRGKEVFSDASLKQAYLKTQGWAAGLVLILERAKIKGIKQINLENLSFEGIYEYFATEVLNQSEIQQQEFLLKSCFLAQMTPAMVNELTERADAKQIISYLYTHHYFLEKHSQKEGIYQYHPLFRDFLKNRANATFSITDLRHTKRRAAGIFLKEGYLADAIELIFELKDWPWLEKLLVDNAPELIMQGADGKLTQWLNRFPETIFYKKPWLLYWHGVSCMVRDPQKSQDSFEIAFSIFRKSNNISGLYLSWSGIILANIYKFKSGDSFEKWIPVIYNLMEEFPDIPSENLETEVLISFLTGLILTGTNHDEIKKKGSRLLELYNRTENDLIRKKAGYLLSLYLTLQGQIHHSETLLAALDFDDKEQKSPLILQVIGRHRDILTHFHCARNNECIELVLNSVEISAFQKAHIWLAPLWGHAVAASLSEGDIESGNEFLQKMKSELVKGQNIETFYYNFLYSWAVLSKDLFAALQLAQNALNLASGLGISYLVHTSLIAVSQIYHEIGQEEHGWEYLQKAKKMATTTHNPLTEYKNHLTEAFFSLQKGDEKQTAELLEKALHIGRHHDIVNFLFWRGSVMANLCARALELGIEAEYVKSLIRKRNLTINASLQNVENWPWKVKIYTLGRFEIKVDNVLLTFKGKVQKTPLTALKILISLGCTHVKEERISDILWPDSSGDAGYRALVTTLQRLRRLLKYKEAIHFNEGRLSINPYCCWVDIWSVKNQLKLIQSQWKNIGSENRIERVIKLTETLFEKHKEAFLPGDEECPWTFAMRDNLQMNMLKSITQLADYWENQKDWKKTLELYQKGLEINSTSEDLFQRLMLSYQNLGCRAEAITAFNQCQKNLSSRLGIEPSSRTKAIFDSVSKAVGPQS